MTSHLLTDGFVSGISFFFLPVSPLCPPSLFGSQSKAERLLYLRRVGLFCAFFFLSGRRTSVGRGRPLRGGGGGGTRVHAAAARQRTGSYTAVRGLQQSGRVGQNLRPGGTSACSCGKKPDTRARGREPERRARDTDRQEGERAASACRRGSRSAVSRSCHWGQRAARAGASTTPRHLPCARPHRRAHARWGREREKTGGRSPALPRCCIYLLSEMTTSFWDKAHLTHSSDDCNPNFTTQSLCL